MKIINHGNARVVVVKDKTPVLIEPAEIVETSWQDLKDAWIVTEDDSFPEIEVMYEKGAVN